MSITLNTKVTDAEMQRMVREYLLKKEITYLPAGKSSKGYKGSRHLGKSTYMKGNRRAA
mgnify:CR=1 FL=1